MLLSSLVIHSDNQKLENIIITWKSRYKLNDAILETIPAAEKYIQYNLALSYMVKHIGWYRLSCNTGWLHGTYWLVSTRFTYSVRFYMFLFDQLTGNFSFRGIIGFRFYLKVFRNYILRKILESKIFIPCELKKNIWFILPSARRIFFA